MLLNKIKYCIFIIFLLFSNVYSQNVQYNKCNELRNAFILGLDEKGLEIGLEIISNVKYQSEREEGLKLLGDYFFYKAVIEDSTKQTTDAYAKKAYAMYGMFITEYPNSKNIKIVNIQLNTLKNFFTELELFGDLFTDYSMEASIVNELYKFGDLYELFSDEKPITGWQLLLQTESKFLVANKYYDTIILNHPKFEVYGYYLKVMSYINNYKRWTTDGNWYKYIGVENRNNIYDNTMKFVKTYLDILDRKYPRSNYTLDAHFTLAGHIWNNDFLKKKERIEQAKYHLEKILENDIDKLGFRYVLTKEFVIRNF
ncbi:hypothetical protein ACFL5D_02210 [Candidatus Neomarinimicrobiota bacterium]